MTNELWRPIKANPRYFVSNKGRVVGPSKKIVSIFKDSNGYHCISFPGLSRVRIHNLVAEAFIGRKPATLQVNHKDGNKDNNTAENLEYITQTENLRHAFRTGLMKIGRRKER
jgi:hypothetical protein